MGEVWLPVFAVERAEKEMEKVLYDACMSTCVYTQVYDHGKVEGRKCPLSLRIVLILLIDQF